MSKETYTEAFEVWHKSDPVLRGDDYYDVLGFMQDADREIKRLEAENAALREKLAALVQAGSDGRLVVLPCKVGSRVYEVFDKYTENKGCGICCCKNIEDTDCEYGEEIGDDFICTNNYIGADGKGGIISTRFKYEMIPYFGKTVFLTREAAEAALAAMEGEHE